MTIIEKIRAEVERLKKTDGVCQNNNETADVYYSRGAKFVCDDLLSVLSDLEKSEKPMNSNEGLEEEIQKYMSERWEFGCINPTTPVYLYDFTTDELKECARHFAQWQKEQMMKEAVEISYKGGTARINGEEKPFEGGKVRIIIVKED